MSVVQASCIYFKCNRSVLMTTKNYSPKRRRHIASQSVLRGRFKARDFLPAKVERASISGGFSTSYVTRPRIELGAYNVDFFRIKALLNNRGDKTSQLRFPPPYLVRKFHVDEVEPLECVILFDTTV